MNKTKKMRRYVFSDQEIYLLVNNNSTALCATDLM